jgi:RimK-like ATP-grasp domain
MILLWGLPGDSPLAKVRAALGRRGAAVAFIDQRAVLETEIELTVGGTVQGVVRTPGRVISLDQVTAAYVRPYSSAQLPAIERAGMFSAAWRHALSIDDALMSWADLAPADIVNRPAAMASNSAKPYQALFIETAGFDVPATLVTTDPDAVREFWAEQTEVIYKSLSGVRSVVAKLEARHDQRLEHVRWCPTQFQQYIQGPDYRVHVIGDEVFTCEICSPAIDYRYASQQGLGVEIRPYQLPRDVSDRCQTLSRSLGLNVTGIDLRRNPEGRWYCFEVNPSPAFTYYQAASNQPIDEAIADFLVGSPRASSSQDSAHTSYLAHH